MPAAVRNQSQWAGRKVLGIVLHDTEGYWNVAVSMFQNPSLLVSAHYIVTRTGRIIQMVKDEDIAYHVRGTWSMLPGCLKQLPDPVFCSRVNGYAIGIEFELLPNQHDYTDAQYDAGGSLLAKLSDVHNVPYDRTWIKGHYELQNDRRDPRGFDWARVGL